MSVLFVSYLRNHFLFQYHKDLSSVSACTILKVFYFSHWSIWNLCAHIAFLDLSIFHCEVGRLDYLIFKICFSFKFSDKNIQYLWITFSVLGLVLRTLHLFPIWAHFVTLFQA